jgi:hypothetical protein
VYYGRTALWTLFVLYRTGFDYLVFHYQLIKVRDFEDVAAVELNEARFRSFVNEGMVAGIAGSAKSRTVVSAKADALMTARQGFRATNKTGGSVAGLGTFLGAFFVRTGIFTRLSAQ